MLKASPLLTDHSLAIELGMSLNHLHILLEALQKEGILSAVSYKNKTIGYQPAQAIELITLAKVCQSIDKSQELMASIQDSIPMKKIKHYLEEINHCLETSPENQPVYLSLS